MTESAEIPMVTDEPSYRRRLPAGILDSGFASMASFAVGLIAVNLFDDVNRGVYAVFFAAFLLGQVIPRNLTYMPAEVYAVSRSSEERISVVRWSIPLGIGPAIFGALAAAAAFAVTIGYATPSVGVGLFVTSAIAAFLSPMQDHARAMFHIAALSWRASLVSVIQLTTVVVCLVVAIALDLPIGWVPFGALAIANGVSLTAALVIARMSTIGHAPPLDFRTLTTKGVWLVLGAVAPSLAAFAVTAIIAALAGPEAAGYAESARVVAQPVMVLFLGLSAVLSPRSMRAAMDLDKATARRTFGIYMGIIAVAGAAYLGLAGTDWILNPMAYLVPSAYVVSGLVAVTIVANIVWAPVFLQIAELLGAHREKTLAGISWIINPLQIIVASTAGVIGAFARPVGLIVALLARLGLQHVVIRSVFAAGHELSAQDPDGVEPPVGSG